MRGSGRSWLMDSAGSLADRDANELHPGCPPTVASAPVLRRVHTADTGAGYSLRAVGPSWASQGVQLSSPPT